MSDKSNMQRLLEAHFQQLAEEERKNQEVPAGLRKEVFRTLDMIDQAAGLTDFVSGRASDDAAIPVSERASERGNESSEEEA